MAEHVELQLKYIEEYKCSNESAFIDTNKLEVRLKNGAECDYNGNMLTCVYNIKSHNPYKLDVKNPSKDYRFQDKIEIKNIILKEPEKACTVEYGSERAKMLEFSGKDDTKVSYVAHYPKYSKSLVNSKYKDPEYHDKEGSIKITNQKCITNIKINGLEANESDKEHLGFEDVYKGGTQSIIESRTNDLEVVNKGLRSEGSKFFLDMVTLSDRSVGETDLELKYQDNKYREIEYQTEPEAKQHSLYIDIVDIGN